MNTQTYTTLCEQNTFTQKFSACGGLPDSKTHIPPTKHDVKMKRAKCKPLNAGHFRQSTVIGREGRNATCFGRIFLKSN